ncbi:glycosyltransferase [Candidatus Curtissbacteria bacterium]|nr:glycosyltransferase [Candidatus Curtissbacteria bacterium]
MVNLVGFVENSKTPKYFQRSKLHLNPIQWEEPFGLTTIESMSCGTPVVAFARGSMPEIIKDGENGLLVNPSDTDIRGDWIIKRTGVAGFIDAVNWIYRMSTIDYRSMRIKCSKYVQENFTIDTMVKKYEALFLKETRKASQ